MSDSQPLQSQNHMKRLGIYHHDFRNQFLFISFFCNILFLFEEPVSNVLGIIHANAETITARLALRRNEKT